MRAPCLMLAGALLASAAPLLGEAPAAPPATRPAGAVMGPAIHVSRLERSLDFYVKGLGMTVKRQMGPPQHRETILGFGSDPAEATLLLLDDTTRTAPPAPIVQSNGYDRLIVRMVDLPAVAVRLRAGGYAPGEVRSAAAGYRVMIATDPDGYRLELVERIPAAGARP